MFRPEPRPRPRPMFTVRPSALFDFATVQYSEGWDSRDCESQSDGISRDCPCRGRETVAALYTPALKSPPFSFLTPPCPISHFSFFPSSAVSTGPRMYPVPCLSFRGGGACKPCVVVPRPEPRVSEHCTVRWKSWHRAERTGPGLICTCRGIPSSQRRIRSSQCHGLAARVFCASRFPWPASLWLWRWLWLCFPPGPACEDKQRFEALKHALRIDAAVSTQARDRANHVAAPAGSREWGGRAGRRDRRVESSIRCTLGLFLIFHPLSCPVQRRSVDVPLPPPLLPPSRPHLTRISTAKRRGPMSAPGEASSDRLSSLAFACSLCATARVQFHSGQPAQRTVAGL